MSTLHINLRLVDPDLTVRVDDLPIDYNRKKSLSRILAAADGVVALDFSEVGTMSALYIHTSSPITLGLNGGGTTVVETDLLVTNGMAVVSMHNLDPTVDASVDIYAYGSV